MATATHAEMHAEHRNWSTEHAMWRDEIQLWREELQKARSELSSLEAILRDHEQALDAHLETISEHEAAEHEHEQALAAYRSESADEKLVRMAPIHESEAKRHRQQRDAHERVKKHQHTLMARWSLLLKALREAM
jgi:chromosome segregation ATPase